MTFARMIHSPTRDERKTFRVDPEHLETLIDKLHQYLFVKDAEGYFIYGNKNFLELLGVSLEELRGKTDADFFSDNLVAMFRKVDQTVCETGKDWEGEESIPFPCGEKLDIWVNKTPLREDSSSQIVGVVGIFADVTRNRKEYRQYLSKKTNDLVHEILLPLQAISSNLENLIANENGQLEMSKAERYSALKTSTSQLHVLGMAAENTQKALLGDTERPYVFRKQSIRLVLEECIDVLAAFADQKCIEFRPIKLSRDLRSFPRIEMSRPDLTRAFKNVYHNAVKYSYSGSVHDSNSPYLHRWVSTFVSQTVDGNVLVSIENYGIGIQSDELPFVLDEGYRGRLSIDRHRTGSGIGLSEVKKIVDRHGGWTTIESIKKGGPWLTTLNVVLPHSQDGAAYRYDQDLETVLSEAAKST